jgi:hypothetical protein
MLFVLFWELARIVVWKEEGINILVAISYYLLYGIVSLSRDKLYLWTIFIVVWLIYCTPFSIY